MSKSFSHEGVVKCPRNLNFEKKDTASYEGKNDGVWLLWGIFKEYLKQIMIYGLTALPLPSTYWNFSLNLRRSLLKRKFEPCTITAVLLQMKSKCTFHCHLQIDKKTNNVHKNRSNRKNWSKLWLWSFSKKESYVVHISFYTTRDWNSR